MRTTETALAVLGLALLLSSAGCGKKGALLPPLSNIPNPPADIRLTQRGAALILEWKAPTTYIDGHPLSALSAVEVWLVEDKVDPSKTPPRLPSLEEFASQAKLVVRLPAAEAAAASPEKPGAKAPAAKPPRRAAAPSPVERYEYAIAADKPDGLRFVFALRAVEAKRKVSAFSELKPILTRALPSPPTGLQAEVKPGAIDLSWTAPSDNIDHSVPAAVKGYNLYRSVSGAPGVRLNASLIKPTRSSDTTFEFGQDTVYTVRAAAEEAEPFGESADSAPCRLTPRDTFAPAPPAGLMSMAGPDFISLTWDVSPEKDLAGYRVWRRSEGQPEFQELTTAPIKETAFQDNTAERGRRYEYAVTAEDLDGNRSAYSASVMDQIKGTGR